MRSVVLSIWTVITFAMIAFGNTDAKLVHKGQCPVFAPGTLGICIHGCSSDADCKDYQKCCSNGCGQVCMDAVKPGNCPSVETSEFLQRLCQRPPEPQCSNDAECRCNEKCCRQAGCGGYQCEAPVPGKEDFVTRPPKLCTLPMEVGQCRAAIRRWFYNVKSGKCEEFSYGGCCGNYNNFERREECEKTCGCPSLDCLKYIKCANGIATDENGCNTCKCIDPCEDYKCDDGQKCIVQAVNCVMAPCPPIAVCVE